MVRFWRGLSFKIEDSSLLAVCSHDLSLAYVYVCVCVCVCREREREDHKSCQIRPLYLWLHLPYYLLKAPSPNAITLEVRALPIGGTSIQSKASL